MDGAPNLNALLTASQAALWVREYRPCTVQAIVNWRRRGHLQPEAYDDHGRPLYTLLGVAKAEHLTRKRARR